MIRYLKHSQINKIRWDECIEQSPNGIIYAYSWYLDVVCSGWDALIEDDYSAVLPVTKGRKYLMDYIFPPFFAQQLGVFSKNEMSEEACRNFLNSIPSAYRYVEMNLHSANKWIPSGYTVKNNTNCVLRMNRPYDEIYRDYKENHTRNIQKARGKSLKVVKSNNVDTIIEMFRSNRGRFIATLEPQHYRMFQKLYVEALKRKMTEIWTVENESGVACAGAVFFQSHTSAIFIFSAVTGEGKEKGAMHYLIDEYIKENCLMFETLDFEGSNNPELARFYRGFGSTEFVYLQIKRNLLLPPWSWFKN